MPLDGTLKDMSLPNLVQLQCTEQKRAQVELKRRNIEGALVFAEGELLHARVGPLAGEDAVYELLGWDEGNFHVNDGITQLPPRNVSVPWQTMVLEGLRRSDEIKSERAQIYARAAAEIKGIAGIAAWQMCTVDGQQINGAGETAASELAEWMATALQEAAHLGQVFGAGNLNEMVFADAKRKRLLLPRERYWVAIETSGGGALSAVRDALARKR